MGKIIPPEVVRVNANEALMTIEQIKQRTHEELTKHQYKQLEAMICPCCGAPLHGDTCEYCGVNIK